MLVVSRAIAIPEDELRFRYVRSSGPGGQNVNKVSTKAELRWRVAGSTALPEDVRSRFMARFGSRINRAGEVLVVSQRYRDRPRNAADCLEKLTAMILSVAQPDIPRVPTRPTVTSKRRRLEAKRKTSMKKQYRRERHAED